MKINSSKKLVGLVVGAASVALMIGSAGNAVAAGAPHATSGLAGYMTKAVNFTATNGAQTFHSLSCPTGDVVTGGGAIPVGESTEVNLNSSYAKGRAWQVWVNNTSGSDATVSMYAVCVSTGSIPGLQTVKRTYKIAAGHDSGLMLTPCPSGLGVYGGGIYSSDSSLDVNITQSYPSWDLALWFASAYNQAGKPDSITIYALCGDTTANYSGNGGLHLDNPAGAQSSGISPTCPAGSAPVSGGLASDSDGPNVWLNGTGPSSGAWVGYEDNNSTSDNTVTGAVICA